jgi:hypothetical protein
MLRVTNIFRSWNYLRREASIAGETTFEQEARGDQPRGH